MAVRMVREVKIWFYVADTGKNFKVWDGYDGGYWVDVVDKDGETVETVGHALDMYGAKQLMEVEA